MYQMEEEQLSMKSMKCRSSFQWFPTQESTGNVASRISLVDGYTVWTLQLDNVEGPESDDESTVWASPRSDEMRKVTGLCLLEGVPTAWSEIRSTNDAFYPSLMPTMLWSEDKCVVVCTLLFFGKERWCSQEVEKIQPNCYHDQGRTFSRKGLHYYQHNIAPIDMI